MKRPSQKRNREHRSGDKAQIGAAIQSSRREAGIHALAEQATAIEPAQSALGAESLLPTLERPELEHRKKTGLSKRGKVWHHREEDHNPKRET